MRKSRNLRPLPGAGARAASTAVRGQLGAEPQDGLPDGQRAQVPERLHGVGSVSLERPLVGKTQDVDLVGQILPAARCHSDATLDRAAVAAHYPGGRGLELRELRLA